jgi:solute carrier family 35 protein E3
MVLYKLIFKGKMTPIQSLMSLAILLVGIGLFTVNDVEFNIPGTIIAAIAVLLTTVYQSRSAYMQSEYRITGPQLNEIVAFPQFVIGFLAGLALETHGKRSILIHEFQTVEVGLILLTGLFAAYGNVIGFIMIGQTGPVTFQVIGHTKTILIFVFGLMLFPPKFAESQVQKIKKICGLVISMIGVIMYTYFELRIREQERIESLKKELQEEKKGDDSLAQRPAGGVFKRSDSQGGAHKE